jgi:2-methylisocitrate lyase-like PEP mutase family enzyme
VFAPGVKERELIEKLVKAMAAPLNILVTPGCPPIPELEELGVARASIGSGVMRSTLGLVRRIGKELLETGTYASTFEGAIPFAEVNALLARTAPEAKRSARP